MNIKLFYFPIIALFESVCTLADRHEPENQAEISDTQVLLTLMEGEPVHGDFSAL